MEDSPQIQIHSGEEQLELVDPDPVAQELLLSFVAVRGDEGQGSLYVDGVEGLTTVN